MNRVRIGQAGQGRGHEHVVNAGEGAGVDECGHAGCLGRVVQAQAMARGGLVIADVNVVDSCADGRRQQCGRQRAKGAGALDDEVELFDQRDERVNRCLRQVQPEKGAARAERRRRGLSARRVAAGHGEMRVGVGEEIACDGTSDVARAADDEDALDMLVAHAARMAHEGRAVAQAPLPADLPPGTYTLRVEGGGTAEFALAWRTEPGPGIRAALDPDLPGAIVFSHLMAGESYAVERATDLTAADCEDVATL